MNIHRRKQYNLTLLLVIQTLSVIYCSENDLTIDIQPGARECFFQSGTIGTALEVEYQVVDGGDLDINFMVQAPDGRVIVADQRKTDAAHKVEVEQSGDYQFCMDNTFSQFSRKLVFFEIIVGSAEDDIDDPNTLKYEDTDELVDMKLEDFRTVMDRMKTNLERSQQVQNILKVVEKRDRSITEMNFERVNFWSGFNLFIMISVGLVQVFMIRSLFDEKSKVNQLFKAQT